VVPDERIAEIHLFPPIRQGPIETGVAVIAATPEDATQARHVVFSARYRWTRKGPDRGRWTHEVVAEADAPLITVEAVVAGVKARANEAAEPERLKRLRAAWAAEQARREEVDPGGLAAAQRDVEGLVEVEGAGAMGADFVAHVVVPDQTAIEQAVLDTDVPASTPEEEWSEQEENLVEV
jgi:hypothetical protein